jgi:starch phosphorylase
MQQYFFVSCSLQDTLHILKARGLSFTDLPNAAALQLNDTHPSIAIAEMMRLLIDENNLQWEEAWQLTEQTFGYTNHTLLPEALEKWSVSLMQSLLPRHLEIIYEINKRFLDSVSKQFPGNEGMLTRLSIIDETGERYVRMAHLATVGSHCINGVSRLHTDLLKRDVLNDFNLLSPGKFVNVTNGVTPRRWIKLYNPELANLITENIGEAWITNLENEFARLESLANDADFQKKWQEVKKNNKKALADQLMVTTGVVVNPDSLFDIQVKRIHEYKRQHLNLLHIITLFSQLKKNPGEKMVPRTFVFGGKAAPGYYQAKLIIKLINAVAFVVNNDPDVAGKIKVVFYPDYNVKNSEWVYRAADLSEQISTAGKEASGTGNMKFSLNGALTIGTLDGANVEMREAIGADNFFLFGMTADEVASLQAKGYHPRDYYESDAGLKQAIDLIQAGYFSSGNGDVFRSFTDLLLNSDPYFVLADYGAYIACQQEVSKAYKNKKSWTKKSILNVARMGYFSSDRSIRDYCREVWNIKIKA